MKTPGAVPAKPKTVLVVEDNELNRDMLSRRLERKGYTLAIAVDGQQAQLESTGDLAADLTRPVEPAQAVDTPVPAAVAGKLNSVRPVRPSTTTRTR